MTMPMYSNWVQHLQRSCRTRSHFTVQICFGSWAAPTTECSMRSTCNSQGSTASSIASYLSLRWWKFLQPRRLWVILRARRPSCHPRWQVTQRSRLWRLTDLRAGVLHCCILLFVKISTSKISIWGFNDINIYYSIIYLYYIYITHSLPLSPHC